MHSFRSHFLLAHGHLLFLIALLSGTVIDPWRYTSFVPAPQGCIVPPGLLAIPAAEVSALGGIVDHNVTNAGFMYVINEVDQPSLTVVRGQSYDFNINVQSVHPFYIQTSLVGAEYDGFNGQGATSGTFTLMIPIDEPLEQLVYICGIHGQSMSNTIEIVDPPVLLVSPIVMLEGPFDGSNLMNDDLRSDGLVPLSEPYSAMGYSFTGANNGSTMQTVLDAEGDDAIVDWVIVELRDGSAPETVIGSRSALLQRDGDVVDTDGVSPVPFDDALDGEYHVAVRHRNHLGVMTADPIALSSTATAIDLTDAGTATFGTDARKNDGGTMLMWAGDVNFDGELKYTGANNDRDPILQEIGGTVPTNTTAGYDGTDANMDGLNRYTGSGNDRDPILENIGGVIPTDSRQQQLP